MSCGGRRWRISIARAGLWLGLGGLVAVAQVDPIPRSLLQLGYDQPLVGKGPQAGYLFYFHNTPELFGPGTALRLAAAPVYFDGELGFRELLSPTTDFGIRVRGGGFSENYYEIRRGRWLEGESFYGHGGGAALNLYQLLNPGGMVPLNVIASGGFFYSTYSDTGETSSAFALPDDRVTTFARAGIRLAGKEPVLYPDLGFELSAWLERQWRSGDGPYGFNGDRAVSDGSNLYWVFANLDYAWTNIGHKVSLAVTAGAADDADRFSAWRLGGVLPLVAEFPLIIPGYYYQELSAERFVHIAAAYAFPLDRLDRWHARIEGAAALIDYLPGLEEPSDWQRGAGAGISFTSRNKIWRVIARYGYAFDAVRGGDRGAQSVGILLQHDFRQWKRGRQQ